MTNRVYNRYFAPYSMSNLYSKYAKPYVENYAKMVLGYRQYENTTKSYELQRNYDDYIRRANIRAYRDWQKNVSGRTIKYPEFSYPGQAYRASTSIARSYLDSDTAYANYYGGLVGRSLGLYSVPGRVYRTL